MTNEEAKEFLDNLKICISEHPIVADWLVEIADRKTEPTISKMEQVEDDAYFLELMGAVERGEISDAGANQAWYEYINHKDEPTTQTETQNSNLTFEKADEPQTEPLQTCSVNGRPYDCGNCEYFRCTADEPQTERSE